MNVLSLIGQVFKPAAELIDNMHTSQDEKLARKAQLLELQQGFLVEALSYEQERLKQRAEIIKAEANSYSWLARNWRPITMLTFLGLVMLDQTGLLAFRLAPEAWTLLQLGLGGYVIGRSVEKTVVPAVNAFKQKEK